MVHYQFLQIPYNLQHSTYYSPKKKTQEPSFVIVECPFLTTTGKKMLSFARKKLLDFQVNLSHVSFYCVHQIALKSGCLGSFTTQGPVHYQKLAYPRPNSLGFFIKTEKNKLAQFGNVLALDFFRNRESKLARFGNPRNFLVSHRTLCITKSAEKCEAPNCASHSYGRTKMR